MDKINVHKAVMGHVQAMSTRPLFGGQRGTRPALRLQLHEMQQIYFKVTTESTAIHISTLYLLCMQSLASSTLYGSVIITLILLYHICYVHTAYVSHHISFLHVYR